MTTLVASRPEMPGFNSYEADDVHTPSRYCFSFTIPGWFYLLFIIMYCELHVSPFSCLPGKAS